MRCVVPDDSVVVSTLEAVQERHAIARRFVEHVRRDEAGVIMPAPVLFEAYSVVTRMPSPWRLRADVDDRVLRETFAERATELATFNRRDCARLDLMGMTLIVP